MNSSSLSDTLWRKQVDLAEAIFEETTEQNKNAGNYHDNVSPHVCFHEANRLRNAASGTPLSLAAVSSWYATAASTEQLF